MHPPPPDWRETVAIAARDALLAVAAAKRAELALGRIVTEAGFIPAAALFPVRRGAARKPGET